MHSDGNIEILLDLFLGAGIEGINPVGHKAGMDVLRLKERYGDRLAFIGGVDNAHILPSGEKARIRARDLPILDAARGGGTIIGTYSIGMDVPVEAEGRHGAMARRLSKNFFAVSGRKEKWVSSLDEFIVASYATRNTWFYWTGGE